MLRIEGKSHCPDHIGVIQSYIHRITNVEYSPDETLTGERIHETPTTPDGRTKDGTQGMSEAGEEQGRIPTGAMRLAPGAGEPAAPTNRRSHRLEPRPRQANSRALFQRGTGRVPGSGPRRAAAGESHPGRGRSPAGGFPEASPTRGHPRGQRDSGGLRASRGASRAQVHRVPDAGPPGLAEARPAPAPSPLGYPGPRDLEKNSPAGSPKKSAGQRKRDAPSA